MKNKILSLLLLFTLLSSCSLDDDTNDFLLEVVPIESVVVPEEFIFGDTYQITVEYSRPSDCHVFNNFFV